MEGMKEHSRYHYKGVPGLYPADPVGTTTVLYRFDTEGEMRASGLIGDPRRTTCYKSGGSYFVGGHFGEAGDPDGGGQCI